MCRAYDNFTSFLRNFYLEYIYLYLCIFDDYSHDNNTYDTYDTHDAYDTHDTHDTYIQLDEDEFENKNKHKHEIELKHYSNDIYNKENTIIIVDIPSNLSNIRLRKIDTEDKYEDFVIMNL